MKALTTFSRGNSGTLSIMNNQKLQPLEGENGRIYFNYPVHALFDFKSSDGNPLFEYEVLDCELVNGEEQYRLACNGVELTGTKSLEQVRLLFGFFHYDIANPGEPKELPLLEEEVRQYYEDLAKDLNKANASVTTALKSTEYFRQKSSIELLTRSLRFAKAQRDEKKIPALQQQIKELQDKQTAILNSMGIDINILTKKCSCTICGDSGIGPKGNICQCAMDRAEEIKIYNAELRLARRNQGKL